jgi:hypothetical protein
MTSRHDIASIEQKKRESNGFAFVVGTTRTIEHAEAPPDCDGDRFHRKQSSVRCTTSLRTRVEVLPRRRPRYCLYDLRTAS